MNNPLLRILLIAGVIFVTGSLIAQVHAVEEDTETRTHTDVNVHDVDSDDDGLYDGTEAGVSEGDTSDTDSDGLDDATAPAKGYNASRSNKPSSRVADPDDTDSDETERAGYNNSRSNRSTIRTKEIDKASPKLMDVLSMDKTTPLLYDGVRIRAPQVCGEDGCDDDDPIEPPTRRNISIHVSGDDVRGWSEEKKQAVRDRLAQADEATSANDFGIRVASAAIENENVVDIATGPEKTEVTYNSRVYLFGFIPKSVTAVARADSGSEVSVDYPWYGFFSRKGDQSFGTSLAADIRADHDVMISVEEEGVERSVREEE